MGRAGGASPLGLRGGGHGMGGGRTTAGKRGGEGTGGKGRRYMYKVQGTV